MATAYKMMELKRNLSLELERRICKEREDILKLAEFMAFLTASYCLTSSALKSMFSHSIWALKLERHGTILYFIASIPLRNRFCFLVAAILFPAFQPGLKFRFDYMIFFQPGRNSARAENPSPVWRNQARIFSPGWIALRAESLSM